LRHINAERDGATSKGGLVSQRHDELIDWIGRCVLPCEPAVRAWLRRASVNADEIDDIVQEAYSRIASIEDFRHIASPRPYFLKVARNILFEQLRRARLIRIDTVAEVESLNIIDSGPSPEQASVARDELRRLKGLIDRLPKRCRTVFVLRKIEDLPQKQIAERLGVSENTVETQVARGMRLILDAWAYGMDGITDKRVVEHGRKTQRHKRH
jgi:RNA polymerase sigma factor (sigma-70 family)